MPWETTFPCVLSNLIQCMLPCLKRPPVLKNSPQKHAHDNVAYWGAGQTCLVLPSIVLGTENGYTGQAVSLHIQYENKIKRDSKRWSRRTRARWLHHIGVTLARITVLLMCDHENMAMAYEVFMYSFWKNIYQLNDHNICTITNQQCTYKSHSIISNRSLLLYYFC